MYEDKPTIMFIALYVRIEMNITTENTSLSHGFFSYVFPSLSVLRIDGSVVVVAFFLVTRINYNGNIHI